METKVNELVGILEEQKEVQEKIAFKREEFEKANDALFIQQREIRERITVVKEGIIADSEIEFKKTGNKKLYGGIGIRISTKILYEEKEAFGWAKEHSLCLKLDSKAFDRIAKTEEIDFVKKEENVTVTFPSKITIEGHLEEGKIKNDLD